MFYLQKLSILVIPSCRSPYGSSVTDRFDYEKSDIDLLVEIDDADPVERGDKLISLWGTFEVFFIEKSIYLLILQSVTRICAKVLILLKY